MPTTRPRVRPFTRCCIYVVASCSIILPAALFILGITLLLNLPGKPISSDWSIMESVVDAAIAVWPVIFAAVVVQCFRTWVLFKALRSYSERDESGEGGNQPRHSRRLDVLSLVVFLILCMSSVGSQALGHVYGVTNGSEEAQVDVYYVDRTGYNQMWSSSLPGSAGLTSTASRSELVQIIGEKYVGVLLSSPGSSLDGLASAYVSSNSGYTSSGSHVGIQGLANFLLGDSVVDAMSDAVASTASRNLTFSTSTSYFNLTCGNWNQTKRKFDNGTSPGGLSYSSSQTLGMNVSSGDNSTITPTGILKFASANTNSLPSASDSEGGQPDGAGPVAGEEWEYSSIDCEYQQLFYNISIVCGQNNHTGVVSCSPYGKAELVPGSTGFAGTQLGDFAQDFALTGNPPTTSTNAPTMSEYS